MNIEIICNEKGTGKTTYVIQKYQPYFIFEENSIEKIINHSDMRNIFCIIDSVENIPEMIFCDLVNYIISIHWKAIILIFDITKEELRKCSNFNKLWVSGIIPKNYKFKNFIASKNIFYDYIKHYFPEQKSENYDNIIEIANYNFNNIDRLMLLNNLQGDTSQELSANALSQYIEEAIKKKYTDIPNADILLQKAAIIGEKFACDALESPKGFGLKAASSYIRQMEEMHAFIKNCIDKDWKYEFISHDIYNGKYKNISCENKILWTQILVQYYKFKYEHCSYTAEQIEILIQLNSLYVLLPFSIEERKSVCFLLLYLYRKNQHVYSAIEMAKTILHDLVDATNSVEYAYIQNFLVYSLMQLGEYKQAVKILEQIYKNERYYGSKKIIEYYYAYCLFQTGNIDLAYTIANNLVEYLKNTSGSNNHKQDLFCKTYSLMATLQNHLKDGDNGLRYYNLAHYHAKKLEKPEILYDILKKSDMFYGFEENKSNLEACIFFYEKNKDWSSAGEIYVNLATEMMFQDCKDKNRIKEYFEIAINYFEINKSRKITYAKNNYAIFLALVENNIEKALHNFKKALLVGLSDFTYMSIYLNICICHILQDNMNCEEFEDAYNKFKFAKKKLNKREHASKYEDMYEIILEILIDERIGNDVVNLCEETLNMAKLDDFFKPILKDIINRNRNNNDSCYVDNYYFYSRINDLKCFFAEFRFWE